MHQFRLNSALLLGLSSLSLIVALPTHESSEATTTRSAQSGSTSRVSKTATSVEKLTPDNTCGDIENGENNGYTCDSESKDGGPCCSRYVSAPLFLCGQLGTHPLT